MATFEFTKLHPQGMQNDQIRFDSSPTGSLERAYGYKAGSVRLDRKDEIEGVIHFDVYAIYDGTTAEVQVGTMTGLTREAHYRRLR